ncbi:MAG: hypothetical protein PCFJNLEI_02030 [Verrucomicrobiae bacterium]|nr:hypothetical protein [Verrucomicrobiae bacterium]
MKLNSVFTSITAMSLTLVISGCSTPGMALKSHTGSLASPKKPIGLFTLRTENSFKPHYVPEPSKIHILCNQSQKSAVVACDRPYKMVVGEYYEYLISVELERGDYVVGNVQGIAAAPRGLGIGRFGFPINTQFTLPNGITYLGHITMTNRERKEGEPRSGPVWPLIDQSASGFHGGTFDVSIIDRADVDIPEFIKAYPALKDVSITKSIMKR